MMLNWKVKANNSYVKTPKYTAWCYIQENIRK